MFNIKDFFKRVQNTQAGNFLLQSIVSDAVKKVASVEVLPINITISSSKVILGGISQAARSEIFIKKEAILREINTLQGSRKITEIR